jgi:hypothetical protein
MRSLASDSTGFSVTAGIGLGFSIVLDILSLLLRLVGLRPNEVEQPAFLMIDKRWQGGPELAELAALL